jgi:hypothetical protein
MSINPQWQANSRTKVLDVCEVKAASGGLLHPIGYDALLGPTDTNRDNLPGPRARENFFFGDRKHSNRKIQVRNVSIREILSKWAPSQYDYSCGSNDVKSSL